MNYKEELDYIMQLPQKFEAQLKNEYETLSNDQWEFLNYTHERNRIGCDYKNCSHASPKNGIKEVYHVRHRQSGELLRLGTHCYYKLMLGEESLTDEVKKEIDSYHRHLKKSSKKNETSLSIVKSELKIKYDLLKSQMIDLEFSETLSSRLFSGVLLADKYLDEATTLNELSRVVRILEINYEKYVNQLERMDNFFRYRKESTGEILFIDRETGEIW